jgi:hypothetical protein
MATLCRRIILSPNTFLLLARESNALSPKSIKQKAPFSLVKLPSGGLGLQNAKIARLLFAGRPL